MGKDRLLASDGQGWDGERRVLGKQPQQGGPHGGRDACSTTWLPSSLSCKLTSGPRFTVNRLFGFPLLAWWTFLLFFPILMRSQSWEVLPKL